jgi:ArsR family transcriptional regulator
MTDKLLEMESFFLALADKTRLRILNLIRDGEICVCFFTEVLGESQPKISRHLAYLRNAGVVDARREGKWMHYSIRRQDDDGKARVLEETLNWLDGREELRRERDRYSEACCSPETLVRIARTPMSFLVADEPVSDEAPRHDVPERLELEDYLL